MRPSSFLIYSVLLPALLVLQGCNSQPPPPAHQGAQSVDFSDYINPGQAASPDEIFKSDPSTVRLQNMGGDFLIYAHLNHHLPPTLEDLRSVEDPHNPTDFTSPSGQPYVYVPYGLWLSGHEQCIIVYDPVATKDGKRVCLFMGSSGQKGGVSVEVIELTEDIFKSYKPAMATH